MPMERIGSQWVIPCFYVITSPVYTFAPIFAHDEENTFSGLAIQPHSDLRFGLPNHASPFASLSRHTL
ncbi:hypothetical protein A0J61_09234 [Choanephora cucurbitarum]|uniref:Uncharacterized protein n=1 Tax=Choanephora cucurbitarum TaxID=101091 RepID=A0A1C7N0T8_9FUNG|nr:hypothetical protein A0J61_09234 [Choanephora cucurbitarum]